MRPERAIEELQRLKNEANDPRGLYDASEGTAWRARVRGVVGRALGNDHHLVEELDGIRYGLSMWTENTPDSYWYEAFRGGLDRAKSYIEAAIYDLELATDDPEPIDEQSIDPELWAHVRGLVEAEDWGKVASQVPIFVEQVVRTWADADANKYGKALFAEAMADSGELRLGVVRGEWEGWRALGVGFAQAIRNASTHRVESRADLRRYAIGVLGLGSLLLTQMRFEHGPLIAERTEGSD